MASDPIETVTHGSFTIRIYPDYDAENPRKDREQFGTLLFFDDRNKDLADRAPTWEEERALTHNDAAAADDLDALVRHLTRNGAIGPILAVEGLTGPYQVLRAWRLADVDADDWAAGRFGIFFTTRDALSAAGHPADAHPALAASGELETWLHAELDEYNDYLSGNVYGYVVKPVDRTLRGGHGIVGWSTAAGELVPVYGDPLRESCWGFYGLDYCTDEAKRVAERLEADLETAVRARTALYAGGEMQ